MRQLSSRTLKFTARRLLCGNYKFFAMTTLAVAILNFVTTMLLGSVFSSGGLWNLILQIGCSVIIDIFYYLLLTGVIRAYMNLVSGQYVSAQDLLFAFSNKPESIAVFAVIQFILETIMANTVLSYPLDLLTGTITGIHPLRVILVFTVLFLFTWIQLRLTPVLYLYNINPDLSIKEILKEGWTLMHGKCLRLFWLQFSFIGIEILKVLSLGIGTLFAEPYQRTAITLFIEKITGEFFPEPEYTAESSQN